MRSVRFDEELEAKLRRAVRRTKQPASAIIRSGVNKECDLLLGTDGGSPWDDYIGKFASGGGDSSKTGRDFADLLMQKDEKRRRRRR